MQQNDEIEWEPQAQQLFDKTDILVYHWNNNTQREASKEAHEGHPQLLLSQNIRELSSLCDHLYRKAQRLLSQLIWKDIFLLPERFDPPQNKNFAPDLHLDP